jgi:hypothetical protein
MSILMSSPMLMPVVRNTAAGGNRMAKIKMQEVHKDSRIDNAAGLDFKRPEWLIASDKERNWIGSRGDASWRLGGNAGRNLSRDRRHCDRYNNHDQSRL